MKYKNVAAFMVLAAFTVSIIAPVSAQSIAALGEVRTNGKVFIETTGKQWLSAPLTYPLLQNTGIRIDEGSAALYFKEGSRIDLSSNSLVVVDGSNSQYTVQMAKGILAFNMAPGATLTVQTASTSVSVNKKNPLVQKVSLEKSGRVLGVISSSEKGTEVRCISGRIAIDVTPAETKLLSSGESIFVDANSRYKVYNTQAVALGKNEGDKKKGGAALTSGSGQAGAYIAGGLFVGGLGFLAYDGLKNDRHRHASPSTP